MSQDQKEKKLVSFEISNELRSQVDEWCEKYGGNMSLSQFIRTAITEKLVRPIFSEEEPEQTRSVDLSTIELALQQLQEQQRVLTKGLDYLIERSQQKVSIGDIKVNEAKIKLLEYKPKTYSEAAKLVEDIDTMTEAINQLLDENKIQYKRRRFQWV